MCPFNSPLYQMMKKTNKTKKHSFSAKLLKRKKYNNDNNNLIISVDIIAIDTLFVFSNVFTLEKYIHTLLLLTPLRTLSSESVGKLFLGPKQRAFLSLMLLLRINIPPLNHSDHGAVCAHDGNFNFLWTNSSEGTVLFWLVWNYTSQNRTTFFFLLHHMFTSLY